MASSKSLQSNADTDIGRFVITVREVRPDLHAGLKGHDYIAARKLNSQVQRVQTSAQSLPVHQQEAE